MHGEARRGQNCVHIMLAGVRYIMDTKFGGCVSILEPGTCGLLLLAAGRGRGSWLAGPSIWVGPANARPRWQHQTCLGIIMKRSLWDMACTQEHGILFAQPTRRWGRRGIQVVGPAPRTPGSPEGGSVLTLQLLGFHTRLLLDGPRREAPPFQFVFRGELHLGFLDQ